MKTIDKIIEEWRVHQDIREEEIYPDSKALVNVVWLENFLHQSLQKVQKQTAEEMIEAFEKAYKEGIVNYHENVTGEEVNKHYANGAWEGFKIFYLSNYLKGEDNDDK